MDHIAHIRIESNKNNEVRVEEKVTEHCKKTALLARSYSAPFNMESCCLPRKTQKVGNHGISRNKAG